MDIKPSTSNIKTEPEKPTPMRTRPMLMRAVKMKREEPVPRKRRQATRNVTPKDKTIPDEEKNPYEEFGGETTSTDLRRRSWGLIAEHGSPPRVVPKLNWGRKFYRYDRTTIIQFRWDYDPEHPASDSEDDDDDGYYEDTKNVQARPIKWD